jgi:putative transposase
VPCRWAAPAGHTPRPVTHLRRRRVAMPGPPPQQIMVTPRQRRVLEGIVRKETSTQQQVRRARVILAAADGANNEAVGRRVGVTEDTVRTWRGRWAATADALLAAEAEGGAGDDRALEMVVRDVLADEPRPGAPARFTPEQLCQLMAVACEPPGASGRPISQWTPRELAEEAVTRGIVERISARTVGRFLVSGSGRGQTPREPVLAHAPRARPRAVGGADRDRLYGVRGGPGARHAGWARGQYG